MSREHLCSVDGCTENAPYRDPDECDTHYRRSMREGTRPRRRRSRLEAPSPCSVEGCEEPTRHRNPDLCNAHYKRAKRELAGARPRRSPLEAPSPCSVEGCEEPTRHRNPDLCNAHYLRARYDATHPGPRKRSRFEAPSPCSVQGCERPVRYRNPDLCDNHYRRSIREGTRPASRTWPATPGTAREVVGLRAAVGRVTALHGATKRWGCTTCQRRASRWVWLPDAAQLYRDASGTYSLDPTDARPMCGRCALNPARAWDTALADLRHHLATLPAPVTPEPVAPISARHSLPMALWVDPEPEGTLW